MKKPEPWPVTTPRPPRGPPRRPGGKPSGPPKRRKKRSIGEPGWNGESSSLLALSSLELLSAMLILTEITDGALRRREAIDGGAEAGDDGSHQREFARGEQRTARCAVGRKRGKIDGTFGHVSKISRARISTVRGAGHLTKLKMGFRALPRAG